MLFKYVAVVMDLILKISCTLSDRKKCKVRQEIHKYKYKDERL